MWWQLFIVLIAATGALAFEDEEGNCESSVYFECEKDDDSKPKDFPGTEEELEEFCKYAMRYFGCAERVLSSCEGNRKFKQFVGELSANVVRVCAENSLIRAAVAENLPCMKKNKEMIASCRRTFRLNFDSFPEFLDEIGVNDIEQLGDSRLRCLNVLFVTGCSSATTGQLCGDVARDVVVNLMQGLDLPFEECPAGIKEKLPDIAKMMQLEAEKVESVENALKRKK